MYIRNTEYLPCKILKKSDLKKERLFCVLLLMFAGGLFGLILSLVKYFGIKNVYLLFVMAVLIFAVYMGLMKRIQVLSVKLRSTFADSYNYFLDDSILVLLKGREEKDFCDNGGYYRIFVRFQQIYGNELKKVLSASDGEMELLEKRITPTRLKIRLLYKYLQSINEI